MSNLLRRRPAGTVARARVRRDFLRTPDRLAAALAVAMLAACGDGTGPDAPLTIGVPAATVLPYQVIEATLGAGVVDQPTVSGSLGEVAISAARVTDSTVSIIVPPVAAGPQVLSLVTGGTTRKSTIQVGTPPAIAEPAAALDAVADRIDATIALHASALELPQDLGTVAGIDTAVLRAQLVTLKQRADAFRASLAALAPAEQAQVAAFFAANPVLLATQPAGSLAPTFARMSAAGTCTGGKVCYDAIDKTLWAIHYAGLAYVGVSVTVQTASWLGGALSKITVEGVQIVTAGVLIGWVLNEIADMTRSAVRARLGFSNPDVIAASAFPMPPALTLAQGQDLPVLRAGTAGAVPVQVKYSSLTSGDLASDPELSGVAKAFLFVQQVFDRIAAMIPFYSAPAPSLPGAALRSVMQVPPPQQLGLGTISPSAFTATASASGPDWMLTFANEKQGADHRVDVQVRFTPPGLRTQVDVASVIVRPKVYRVASLTIVPPAGALAATSKLTLTTVARDSATNVIPAAELGERRPTWTSANPSIATVDAATGEVTGKAKGTARISAVLEGGRADIDLVVSESCDASWVFGSWTGFQFDGSPFTTATVGNVISSVSLTVNTDSTFSATVKWWKTDGYGQGRYGPAGEPITGEIETRHNGRLGISCAVLSDGTRNVQLETLAVTSRMYNTGTPSYEGSGNDRTTNVSLFGSTYGNGEFESRITYNTAFGDERTVRFRKQ